MLVADDTDKVCRAFKGKLACTTLDVAFWLEGNIAVFTLTSLRRVEDTACKLHARLKYIWESCSGRRRRGKLVRRWWIPLSNSRRVKEGSSRKVTVVVARLGATGGKVIKATTIKATTIVGAAIVVPVPFLKALVVVVGATRTVKGGAIVVLETTITPLLELVVPVPISTLVVARLTRAVGVIGVLVEGSLGRTLRRFRSASSKLHLIMPPLHL